MEPEVHKTPIRFYEIDLLRFIAALSVVFYHYTYIGNVKSDYNPLSFTEIGKVTRYGNLGVELFFIISGYVILLSAQGKTVRQFLISRVTRLYPAFWVACTLTFLVKYLWGATGSNTLHMSPDLSAGIVQYGYNLTMLHEFIGIDSMDGPYWSLTIEIIFYFIISLLISYKLLRHIDGFMIAWLVYIALPKLPYSGPLFTLLFIRGFGAYFIAGMLFYLLQQPFARTKLRYGLLAIAYLLALRACMGRALAYSALYHDTMSPVVAAGVVTVFFLIFLLISFQKINLSRFSWLAWLGALTYPLYLVHSDIAFVIFFHVGNTLNKYVLVAGTLVMMLALAYIIHMTVEKRYSRPFGAWLTTWLARLD